MQIHFIWWKFRPTSKEDVDSFLFDEKFRSTPKEDDGPIYFEEKELITRRSLKLTYYSNNKGIKSIFSQSKLTSQNMNNETIKHASSWYEKHKTERVRKQPLAWALFYLRGRFRVERNLFNYLWNLKTLILLANLKEDWEISAIWESQNICLLERKKKVLNYETQALFIEAENL